jgi:hypothetical protein
VDIQLELHVYNPQHKLISYLKSKGVIPQAYSPLGSTNSPLLTDETVVQVATRHALQPADILLGYLRMLYNIRLGEYSDIYLQPSRQGYSRASQVGYAPASRFQLHRQYCGIGEAGCIRYQDPRWFGCWRETEKVRLSFPLILFACKC